MLTPHEALIYTMVAMSDADGTVSKLELKAVGALVNTLPVFENYEKTAFPVVANKCSRLLEDKNGFDAVITQIVEALTPKMRETAYALACDVALADQKLGREEFELLQTLRQKLGIDRLTAAAMERTAAARNAVF